MQVQIIALTSGYLLATAFCGLASSESMWWKCVLVGVNILGLGLLGLGTVISAHTKVMVALIRVRRFGGWQLFWDSNEVLSPVCPLHSSVRRGKNEFNILPLLPVFLEEKAQRERHCRLCHCWWL